MPSSYTVSSNAAFAFPCDFNSDSLDSLRAEEKLWYRLLQMDDNRRISELNWKYSISNTTRKDKLRTEGVVGSPFEVTRLRKSKARNTGGTGQRRRGKQRSPTVRHRCRLLLNDAVFFHEILSGQVHHNTRTKVNFLRECCLCFWHPDSTFSTLVLWSYSYRSRHRWLSNNDALWFNANKTTVRISYAYA